MLLVNGCKGTLLCWLVWRIYLADALLTLSILVYRVLKPISTPCTIPVHFSSLILSLGLLHLYFCELLNIFVLSMIFLPFSFSIASTSFIAHFNSFPLTPLLFALHLLRSITYVVVVIKSLKQLLIHVTIATKPYHPALLSNNCLTRLTNS